MFPFLEIIITTAFYFIFYGLLDYVLPKTHSSYKDRITLKAYLTSLIHCLTALTMGKFFSNCSNCQNCNQWNCLLPAKYPFYGHGISCISFSHKQHTTGYFLYDTISGEIHGTNDNLFRFHHLFALIGGPAAILNKYGGSNSISKSINNYRWHSCWRAFKSLYVKQNHIKVVQLVFSLVLYCNRGWIHFHFHSLQVIII